MTRTPVTAIPAGRAMRIVCCGSMGRPGSFILSDSDPRLMVS